jgi:hypothetical protein
VVADGAEGLVILEKQDAAIGAAALALDRSIPQQEEAKWKA